MYNKSAIFLLLLFFMACQNSSDPVVSSNLPIPDRQYPEALQKIFAKHGSLELWQSMNTLSYEIEKEGGNEKQVVDVRDRRERIEGTNFIAGFDGKHIWLEADTSYKGNAIFYHNLMFYFYAMPFVIADDGINYSETAPLEFEGKSYPGIRITYDAGVGVSPEDEYFIHYDPTNYQMAWLGYTVTYYSKEKSKEIKWIHYDDWKTFNGLLLPKSMNWFQSVDGQLTEPKKRRRFVNIEITEKKMGEVFFNKTAGASVIE